MILNYLNTRKIQNGILWGTTFSVVSLPFYLIMNNFLIKKINVSNKFKKEIRDQLFLMLIQSSIIFGFLYGYTRTALLKN